MWEINTAIAIGFGLQEDALCKFVSKSDNNLRLLHYPSVDASKFTQEARRIGAHTGLVKLISQTTEVSLFSFKMRAEDWKF